eukprot:1161395-Pelagomonas_calceolata.AAC.1
MSWFALDQYLFFEYTSSKICHRRIAPDLRSLWAMEVACHLHEVICKCTTADFVLGFLFRASLTSMEPAQQGFHVNEEEEGREYGITPFQGFGVDTRCLHNDKEFVDGFLVFMQQMFEQLVGYAVWYWRLIICERLDTFLEGAAV